MRKTCILLYYIHGPPVFSILAQSSRVRVAETIIWRALVLGAVFLANVNSQGAAAVAEVRLHRDVRGGHSCRRVEGRIVQVLVRPGMLNTRGVSSFND